MTADEVIRFVTRMPGVVPVTAGEANGAPEVACGDTFFPFATIVTKDYDGFDTASDLDRPDVFRLNISVGRDMFAELIGYSPAAHAEHQADFDYAALDRLLPHPVGRAHARAGEHHRRA